MNNVKKSIGWADYTVNPVKGLCPVGCSYCYARRAYARNCNATFKDKSIRFEPKVLMDAFKALKRLSPSRIFVGSTMELFGEWAEDALPYIFAWTNYFPQHTFIFLTKQPQNLAKWSPFPVNCHVGVSATDHNMLQGATGFLRRIEATVKFVSIEPLLRWQQQHEPWLVEDWQAADLSWLILGRQTPVSAKTAPKVEWVREIVEAADKAGVPVFLKKNLWSCFVRTGEQAAAGTFQETWDWGIDWPTFDTTGETRLRQEFPSQSAGLRE